MNPASAGRPRSWLLAAAIVVVAALIVLENFGGGALDQFLLYLPGVDKPLHVAQSFVIARIMFLVARVVSTEHAVKLAVATGSAIALALFDEWQQRWVGGRSIEIADVLAGFAGVAFAAASLQIQRARRFAATVALVAATVAVAVTANTYRITKDFNRGLLALERGDMTVAYEHLRAAHGAGVRTSGLYNALAWAAIESGAGSPAEAVRLAEESLRLRPGNADALDTYGWALHKSGRSAEALVPLMEALKKKPRMYCIHYHLGAAYLGSGDIVRASGHLQRQIDEQPQTREAMLAVELLARIARSSTN